MQNKAQIVLYDLRGNNSNIYYEEENEGWLRILPLVFHDEYVIIVKLQDSGTPAGRFQHATRFEYKDGKLVGEKDLTPGAKEVISILAVDHARKRLYYLGNELDEPSHRNVYSVQLDGNGAPVCLSCNVFSPEGKYLKLGSGFRIHIPLFRKSCPILMNKHIIYICYAIYFEKYRLLYRKSLHLCLRVLFYR